MCRFYGMHPYQVQALDSHTFQDLWLAIDQLEAQEFLVSVKIATYPHATAVDQKNIHRDHYKKAYPEAFEQQNPSLTLELLKKSMNNLGNG